MRKSLIFMAVALLITLTACSGGERESKLAGKQVFNSQESKSSSASENTSKQESVSEKAEEESSQITSESSSQNTEVPKKSGYEALEIEADPDNDIADTGDVFWFTVRGGERINFGDKCSKLIDSLQGEFTVRLTDEGNVPANNYRYAEVLNSNDKLQLALTLYNPTEKEATLADSIIVELEMGNIRTDLDFKYLGQFGFGDSYAKVIELLGNPTEFSPKTSLGYNHMFYESALKSKPTKTGERREIFVNAESTNGTIAVISVSDDFIR